MIVWDDSILTGIPKIDSDHKSIVEHINQFIADIEAESNTAVIHNSFRKMERRIYRHLDVEEKMIKAVGFEHVARHLATHSKLTDDLENIWDEMLGSPEFRPDDAARKWIEGWLFVHVRNEDFMFRDWILQAGLLELAEELMAD